MDERCWPGEPGECTCTQLIVGTFEETLNCPLPFRPVPGGKWGHVIGAVP